MSEQSLVINFSSIAPADDPYWLTIEVGEYSDTVTIEEAAAIVDDLYDTDPCLDDGTVKEEETITETEVIAAVFGSDPGMCAALLSGDYENDVRIIRSHLSLPYKLTVSVGEVKQTVKVVEGVTVTVDVKDEINTVLPYPVVSGIRVSWMGSGPAISLKHNTLFWAGNFTGTLRASYTTEYDIVTVAVPGIRGESLNERERGEKQSSDILVFYHYQTYLETIDAPPDDPAATDDYLADVCEWENGQGSRNTDEEEEEPEPIEPVEPLDPCLRYTIDVYQTSYKPGTQLFDDNKCCNTAPKMSSECMELKVGNVSTKELSQEKKTYYESLTEYCSMGFCENVQRVDFVAVGPNPEDPEGCGRIINKTVVQQRNCCDEVEPMELLLAPSVMADNSNAFLQVVGGSGQYQFRVLSPGLYFKTAGGYPVHVGDSSSGYITLYSDNICGTVTVQVVDTCGNSISIPIRATDGRWEYYSDDNFLCSVAEGSSYTVNGLVYSFLSGENLMVMMVFVGGQKDFLPVSGFCETICFGLWSDYVATYHTGTLCGLLPDIKVCPGGDVNYACYYNVSVAKNHYRWVC